MKPKSYPINEHTPSKLGMVHPGLCSGSLRALIYNLSSTIKIYLTGRFNVTKLCIMMIPIRKKKMGSPTSLSIQRDHRATLVCPRNSVPHDPMFWYVQFHIWPQAAIRGLVFKKNSVHSKLVIHCLYKIDIPYRCVWKLNPPKSIGCIVVGCISQRSPRSSHYHPAIL